MKSSETFPDHSKKFFPLCLVLSAKFPSVNVHVTVCAVVELALLIVFVIVLFALESPSTFALTEFVEPFVNLFVTVFMLSPV